VEQNKGENFRFWIGTRDEYESQKSRLKENTFCIITDDYTEKELVAAIEKTKGKVLYQGINADELYSFDYFVGLIYNDDGNVNHSVVFNIISSKTDEIRAVGTDYGWADSNSLYQHRLRIWYENGVGYVYETTVSIRDFNQNSVVTNPTSFDKIIGMKVYY
jgi:hypothetical protein